MLSSPLSLLFRWPRKSKKNTKKHSQYGKKYQGYRRPSDAGAHTDTHLAWLATTATKTPVPSHALVIMIFIAGFFFGLPTACFCTNTRTQRSYTLLHDYPLGLVSCTLDRLASNPFTFTTAVQSSLYQCWSLE